MVYLVHSLKKRVFMAALILMVISCRKTDADQQVNKMSVPTDQEILNGRGTRQSTGPSGIIIHSPEGHIIGQHTYQNTPISYQYNKRKAYPSDHDYIEN